MNIPDDLVTKITEEIIRRISSGGSQAAAPSPPPPPSGLRPDLIVTGPPGDPLGRLPSEVKAAINAAYVIHPVNSFEAEGLPKVPLLLPCLPIQPLVRVAHGDEGCTVEGRQLLCALLEGRSAVVWEDGIVWRRYSDTAPKSLVSIWKRCESALIEAGVKLVPHHGILDALAGRASNPSPTPPAWSGAAQRANERIHTTGSVRVLTEAKVMEMFPNGSGPGRLELKPGDMLTPLAKDYLAAQKIQTC